MTRRRRRLAASVLTAAACVSGCTAGRAALESPAATTPDPAALLRADLDGIFDAPPLARALIGVRVLSLADGRVVYERDAEKRVVPASNMKLVTVAVAAEHLGWDFTYRTRLEVAGAVTNGTLEGDLVVTGEGDPTITSQGGDLAPLLLEWADAVARAGIRRVAGRVIGDDDAFDDRGLGAGWAWDYLEAGYAAPSSALSFNENIVVLEIAPGRSAGDAAAIGVTPAGHGLEIVNDVQTSASGSRVALSLLREPGSVQLTVRGSVPVSSSPVIRTAAVTNPTRFFVEAFRLALASRGIEVTSGAWDVDDLAERPHVRPRTALAERESAPLSALAAHTLKVSQNMYGETLLKTLGRTSARPGSAAAGRETVTTTLSRWTVAPESIVMVDGSGLSRYNYVTAEAMTTILTRMWHDERHRGPFVAALPVGAHDGTLDSRMKNSVLNRRVQAKTGTISNVRALSGYLETMAGEKLAFSMIANHFTVDSSEIDAIMERALERLVRR